MHHSSSRFSQPDSTRPDSPPRILMVRLSAHGDVIHTLPLLAAIKRHWPEAQVGWLTETAAVPLLDRHPLLDNLHVAHRKRWLKALRNPLRWFSVWQEVQALLREIQAEGYTVSLDVQGLLKSALWPWLAKIPERYGFRATREFADRFYTQKLAPMIIRDANTLAVQRYLDFARALGAPVEAAPEFILPPVSEAALKKIARFTFAVELDRPLVALAPFTQWPSKHWEPTYWPRLIEALVAMNACPVLLGATGDRAAADALLKDVSMTSRKRMLDLVGQTDWPDMQVLLARAVLLIGPDSAPLHLADALGIQVIGLFGPTAPGRTGPVGGRHAVLSTSLPCQPCFERKCPIKTHDCMKQLAPEVVAAMARQYLFPVGDEVKA